MSALIVTPTHQSDEFFEEYQPDWVQAQFMSTIPGSPNSRGDTQLGGINLGLSPAAAGFGLSNKETASVSSASASK